MSYKISVIMPIYNVEKYLKESIASVINQTIGFKNIQLILVNDGSTDKCADICEKYNNIYNNIVYINQQNSGVSVARNNGLKYATGEYVTFLDSDDKWPKNAFEKAYSFFEKHKDIDVVACKLEFFEARSGFSHPLNYKFKDDAIIDINTDYDFIQMHMASCFIKRSAIKENFDETLKYAEDSLFINKIILDKQKYGVLNSISYLYRKRFDETSAIDVCQSKKTFYNDTLQGFHDEIINESIRKFGYIIPYVQYLIMYDFQWRLRRKIPNNVLNTQEEEKYKNHLIKLISQIDDYIITEQKNLPSEYKILALDVKYNKQIEDNLEHRKDSYYYNNLLLFSTKNKSLIKIFNINIKNGNVHIEGVVDTPIKKDLYNVFIKVDSKETKLSLTEYKNNTKLNFLGNYYNLQYFEIDLKKDNKPLKVKFEFQYKNGYKDEVSLGSNEISNFNNSFDNGFIKLKEGIVEYKNNTLIFKNNNRKLWFKNEFSFTKSLFKNHKKMAIYRVIIFFLKQFKKKEIWLISDRPQVAGDNGEAFFKYLSNIKDKNIKAYFVLQKNSKDYERLKKYGKILDPKTKWYRVMFLLSDKIISSQASSYVINPFNNRRKFLCDLYNFDFVFLQHGITKDDVSGWLNKLNKNIKLFVTAAMPEYKSILDGNYYYDDSVVKKTGFPRHDYLKNNPKKQIVIMPTWRKSIPGCVGKNDESIYNPAFKETVFFKSYMDVLNDKRLISTMKEYGYTGKLCLHPLLKKQASHFSSPIFEVEKEIDYTKVFEEGSLLITDYSSTFFDFAYLDKPIIYYQFDEEEFFSSHSYEKGYFDYRKDGFGPVLKSKDELVDEIINYIKNNCVLQDKYHNRIIDFYKEINNRSCENVYKEIKNL